MSIKEDNTTEIPTKASDPLATDLPEVKQNAIDAMKIASEENVELAKKQGFDPEIHQTDAQGNPVMTKSGNFAKRRGVKKGSVAGKSKVYDLNAKNAEKAKVDLQNQQNLETAMLASGLIEQATVKLISDEWKLTEEERVNNVKAWQDTFDHYGGVSLSPPQRLFASQMSIILTRATQPKTVSKMGKVKLKLIGWWVNRKLKKNEEILNNGTLSNNRSNDVGKNDSSDQKSAEVKK